MPTDSQPTRIAIIGAGPAGFYAAGHLLADSSLSIEVDMFERLPTPWGLVRTGVAPDHPKIKSVTRIYERTAAHPRFRFFGNVQIGVDVSRSLLARHYHAIVYATGSPTDRPLGIPGEELAGSLAATDFVGWYNAHPDHHELDPLLDVERAVVIGNGNVALDVARMLVISDKALAGTDTADHALEAFATSSIREVIVIGRRGPAQAAFTNPEIRELRDLEGVDIVVDGDELERALQGVDVEQLDVTAKGNVRMLREYAQQTAERGDVHAAADGPDGAPVPAHRRLVFRFLLSPVAIHGTAGRVNEIELAHNRLVADGQGGLRAEQTDEHESIPTGLVLRAIGYRGIPLPEVPFDERHCVIPNEQGRVCEQAGGPVRRGEYVVGWIKRGPSGVIGTNKKDAQETVDALLADLAAGLLPQPPAPDAAEISQLLEERKPDLVTYEGWSAIDRHERMRGEPHGRPRSKLARIDDLLAAAAGEQAETLTGS